MEEFAPPEFQVTVKDTFELALERARTPLDAFLKLVEQGSITTETYQVIEMYVETALGATGELDILTRLSQATDAAQAVAANLYARVIGIRVGREVSVQALREARRQKLLHDDASEPQYD